MKDVCLVNTLLCEMILTRLVDRPFLNLDRYFCHFEVCSQYKFVYTAMNQLLSLNFAKFTRSIPKRK